MRYYTTDRNGITELNPSTRTMQDILNAIDCESDPAAADVWLTHFESGWTLSVFADGFIELERPSEDSLCMPHANMATALRLWRLLADGQFDSLLQQPWKARVNC